MFSVVDVCECALSDTHGKCAKTGHAEHNRKISTLSGTFAVLSRRRYVLSTLGDVWAMTISAQADDYAQPGDKRVGNGVGIGRRAGNLSDEPHRIRVIRTGVVRLTLAKGWPPPASVCP